MIYTNDKIKDLKIAYIGGGSRGWAWRFMADLAMEPRLSGTVHLYDIDETSAKRNEIIGNNIMALPNAEGNWKFETNSTLKEALTDADFVLISILPGTFDEMASDVHYPEKYGIYQSVGDTAGPGGIIRALRTLPMLAVMAESIKENCPEAWVINYTNPMSLCVRVLYDVFPEIKAFGCCHEVFGIQKTLAHIVEKTQAIPKVNREEIIVNVVGVNHFTWFTTASYKGINLFPLYEEFMEEAYKNNNFEEDNGNWLNKNFKNKNRAKYDMFKKYGCIASAGDRHLVEFMPGDLYLKNPQKVADWGFELTTVKWRKEDLIQRMEKSERLIKGEEVPELKASGEEGVRMIMALCGLDRYVTNVNLPNTHHQITNFPSNTVVETNAVFEKNGVRPLIAGKCPPKIYRLELPHIQNQDKVLEAAMTCNKELVIESFMNDPLIRYRLDQKETVDLVNNMIKNTLAYLPEDWKAQVE